MSSAVHTHCDFVISHVLRMRRNATDPRVLSIARIQDALPCPNDSLVFISLLVLASERDPHPALAKDPVTITVDRLPADAKDCCTSQKRTNKA
jgi:hypothetical protein